MRMVDYVSTINVSDVQELVIKFTLVNCAGNRNL